MEQLSGHPEGKIAAEKRMQTAMKIEKAIERITGEKIASWIDTLPGSR